MPSKGSQNTAAKITANKQAIYLPSDVLFQSLAFPSFAEEEAETHIHFPQSNSVFRIRQERRFVYIAKDGYIDAEMWRKDCLGIWLPPVSRRTKCWPMP